MLQSTATSCKVMLTVNTCNLKRRMYTDEGDVQKAASKRRSDGSALLFVRRNKCRFVAQRPKDQRHTLVLLNTSTHTQTKAAIRFLLNALADLAVSSKKRDQCLSSKLLLIPRATSQATIWPPKSIITQMTITSSPSRRKRLATSESCTCQQRSSHRLL